jgi:hypothetical protein
MGFPQRRKQALQPAAVDEMAVLISDSSLPSPPPRILNTQQDLVEYELLMSAQERTLKLLRLTGIVGVITGIAMSIADISLLYSQQAATRQMPCCSRFQCGDCCWAITWAC